MQEQNTEIVNKLGLHARAATKLSKLANSFAATIELSFDGKTADAKSVISVMLLAASRGSTIGIRAEGEDEDEAMSSLLALIADKFEEGE